MPWFKIDDSSYSHPKFVRAGNAALGLWMRCGAYSAQHLLEGQVPGFIAKSLGTPAQARKLIEAGLWHGTGHDCGRCPQPPAGDYMIHDFFEGGRNSTRAQVETSRRAAADRQAKARARAAEKAAQPDSDANRDAVGVSTEHHLGSQLNANGVTNEPQFSSSTAGQEGASRRDGLNGVTPSPAMPRHTSTAGRQSARIPDWAQPLIDDLGRKGIEVSWGRMSNLQWITVQQLIGSHGIPYLVHIAASRWNPRNPIKFGTLLIEIWRDYAPPAPGSKWAPAPPQQQAQPERPPHCGHIDCDPVTRTRDEDVDNGLRVSVRCPECHPSRKDNAA